MTGRCLARPGSQLARDGGNRGHQPAGPFSMALLGWLFIGVLFRPWLPADQIESHIAGHASGFSCLNEERPEQELYGCIGG